MTDLLRFGFQIERHLSGTQHRVQNSKRAIHSFEKRRKTLTIGLPNFGSWKNRSALLGRRMAWRTSSLGRTNFKSHRMVIQTRKRIKGPIVLWYEFRLLMNRKRKSSTNWNKRRSELRRIRRNLCMRGHPAETRRSHIDCWRERRPVLHGMNVCWKRQS